MHCGIKGDKPVVVGVSGGADSLTLFHLFIRLKIPVWVVYFDHQLRPESKKESLIVQQLAEAWKAEGFIAGQEDVRRLAEQTRCSVEAAARQARYRFLFKTAEEFNAAAVAVGHTADDQVETVLMHLIRGSGLDGLSGMDYRTIIRDFSPTVPLIRPLLGFWRTEIEQYCRQNGLQPLQDVTNQSLKFTRNRIRHELIPQLQVYNPRIKNRLWTMSRVVKDHLQVIKPIAKKTLHEVCVESREGEWLAFSASRLKELPGEMLSIVLREAIHVLKPASEDISWQSTNLAIAEIQSDRRTGVIQLGDGVELLFSQERIYLRNETSVIFDARFPNIPLGEEYTLSSTGEVKLGKDWFLQAEVVNVEQIPPTWKEDRFEAWLDAQKVKFPLKIRAWKPGERFRPLGMSGRSVKIADFLTEKKVPRPLRSGYPLVFSGEEAIWLPGLQIADPVRIAQNTQWVLHLKLIRV
ncbi:tRNA(Ile)-lysidine synthetase, N-terminal domain [Bellilinea caldifistulae]|nr:tRNA(Ile)-lysidine synthetase, N-terminal domain [Bellilinea caldifistulae]